jgi:iron complex transport system substrate-binding protein
VGTFWQPNTEAIIASKPDLVVTESFEQQKAAGDSLKKLGYNVLSLKIERIEELFAAIKKIGAVTDCQQRAEKVVKDISDKLNNLRAKFSSSKRVKVLWAVQAEPLRVVGRNTFISEIMELAGGENAIGATVQKYPPIGTEELMACGAEVIIQSAMIKANIADEQKTAETFWSKWAGLPAVKNNRIYVVESDTILRLGPRLPQGVETIGRYLHPDVLRQGNENIK